MGFNFAVLFGVLPVLLITIVLPAALVILLQVFLCKKGKWLGLILPGLTLAVSLLLTLSIGVFSRLSYSGGAMHVYDEHGDLVKQEETHPEHRQEFSPENLLPAAGVFLITNIPTAVLGGIWLHYKNKDEWKEDMRRMKLQDLE